MLIMPIITYHKHASIFHNILKQKKKQFQTQYLMNINVKFLDFTIININSVTTTQIKSISE